MEKLSYEWICSNRKTIAIQIKEEGQIVVRSPYGVKRKTIEHFLKEKQEWIRKKQIERAVQEKKEITAEEREEGIKKALKIFPERVAFYAEKMGVTYSKIIIKEQKTRWGSCSSKGNLNFNWRLVLMPPEILDYVVVHELAHRKEMNHSSDFWKVVEGVLPDYKERRKYLKNER